MPDNKLTAKLGLDTTEYDRKLDQAEKGMGGFGTSMKGIAGKVSIAIGGITAALAVVKKGIDQTDGSSDKFTASVGLLEGAWQGFWRTVWSGDWGALILNIHNTAEATRDLKEAQDSLGMIMASNTIRKARVRGSLYQNILGATESTDPAAKKEFINAAIADQKELTSINVEEINKRLQVNEDFYKKIMGYDNKYSDFMIKTVREISGNWEHFFGKDSVWEEGMRARIASLEYLVQFYPEKNLELSQLKQALFVFEDFKTLQEGLKPDEFEDYIKLIGELFAAYAQGDQDLITLERRLANVNKKFEEQAEIIRQEGPSAVDTSHLTSYIKLTPTETNKNIEAADEMTKALISQQDAVDILSDSFMALFDKTGDGFDDMIDTMIQGIERLIAEMLAKELVKLIMEYFGGDSSLLDIFGSIGGGSSSGSTGGTPSGAGGGSLDYLGVAGEISGKDLKLVARRW
jgi:hypothetical protein